MFFKILSRFRDGTFETNYSVCKHSMILIYSLLEFWYSHNIPNVQLIIIYYTLRKTCNLLNNSRRRYIEMQSNKAPITEIHIRKLSFVILNGYIVPENNYCDENLFWHFEILDFSNSNHSNNPSEWSSLRELRTRVDLVRITFNLLERFKILGRSIWKLNKIDGIAHDRIASQTR